MKKTLAFILSALLVVSMFAVFASAESTNILAGKTYELSGCGVRSTYTANLTDGAATSDLVDAGANWFGFYCNGDDATVINAPDKVGYVIFDLEGAYDIDKVRANIICNDGWGIPAPAGIAAYVSDDGDNWTKADDFSFTLEAGVAAWTEITGDWNAKFLKVEFTLGGTFAFVNEIEAYGVEATADEESSDASSEESSEEVSSEASSEVSSEASSEVSSEASSEVSSEASSEEIVIVSKNVALNKTYTGGEVASQGANYNAKLTDGIASNEAKYDAGLWYGLWYNKDSTTPSVNAPDGVANIVIDLEEVYDLNEIKIHFWNANTSGICAPAGIKASFSENGTDFSEAIDIDPATGDAPAWATKALEGVSGRYVKITINTAGTWCFLNEIEVYGDVEVAAGDVSETPSQPSNPVKPGDASNTVVFVIVALVAVTGSAVVIKNRK